MKNCANIHEYKQILEIWGLKKMKKTNLIQKGKELEFMHVC